MFRGFCRLPTCRSACKRRKRKAGRAERRASDEGGHCIAARFKGPIEAFNYSRRMRISTGAAIACLGMSGREKRAGKRVTVKIVPRFDGGSVRPSVIGILWTVGSKERSVIFPDERSEKARGKRSSSKFSG